MKQELQPFINAKNNNNSGQFNKTNSQRPCIFCSGDPEHQVDVDQIEKS